MALRRILGDMFPGAQQQDLHLQGRVADEAQKLRFSDDFGRHQV